MVGMMPSRACLANRPCFDEQVWFATYKSRQHGQFTSTEVGVEPDRSSLSWSWTVSLALVVAGIFFFFPLFLADRIPLLDPDEGLHASIAQEMVERGDWVVPRLMGKPFLDKPILYFWAEALSLRLFGMSEAAIRMPGLMFGLLGAMTTAAVAWRLFGRTAGMIAGLFYATTVFPLTLAQAAVHDIALVPWVNLALLLLWESEQVHSRRAALGSAAAAGAVLGLAVLTKGLVGVALVGITYGSYLVLSRRLTLASCFRGALTLVMAAVVASTWYVAVEQRSPGYLFYFFVERHLLGFTTATQRHGDAPWWYYLPVLFGGGMPWISYLPAAVRQAWATWRPRAGVGDKAAIACQRSGASAPGAAASEVTVPAILQSSSPQQAMRCDRPLLLVWCWLIGMTLFLSASHSKLMTYIWPAFPAIAILAAVLWSDLLEGRLVKSTRRWMTWTVCGSCLLGPVVIPLIPLIIQRRFAIQFSPALWTVVLLTSMATLTPIWFWMTGRLRATLASAMLAMAAQFVVIVTAIIPQVAPQYSARDLAKYFNHLGQCPTHIVVVDGRIGSLIFYLDPKLRAEVREGANHGFWSHRSVADRQSR